MTTIFIRTSTFILAVVLFITGCEKNYTRYYADADSPGLAVFSNNNNNLLTCYIDGKAWRTKDRRNSGFSVRTNYELYIRQIRAATGATDTIQFFWDGVYEGNPYENGSLGLVLSIPKGSSLSAFLKSESGQRLIVASAVNGYFTTSINRLNTTGLKGNGQLYFNRANFDSISPGIFQGNLAGLFQADFQTFKITKGRFDHELFTEMIQN